MNRTVQSGFVAAILVAGFACVSGCKVGPDFHSPQMSLSDRFDAGPLLLPRMLRTSAPTTAATSTQPTTPSTQSTASLIKPSHEATPVDLNRWWETFNDPELDRLIARAVASNDDLQMAVARLQQARAGLSSFGAEELPTIDFSAGAGRGSGTNNTKGRVGAPLNAGTNTGKVREITEVAGFDAGWEIDLWGQLSRTVEAAQANAAAAEEDRRFVLVSVIADTARSYAELRALQARLAITQSNVAALQRTVDLTRLSFQRQIGNELNVVLAERQLSAAQARIAPLSARIASAERRIAILIGDEPQALYGELAKSSTANASVGDVDIGVPLQVIRRRPDVRRAEEQLAAATARIGVATGNLFPQIALTAGVGFQGQGLGHAPDDANLIWSIGPALRLPLLDFGRLDALVQVENYRTRELTARYRKTVLAAIEEVEDALGNYNADRNRFEQLSVAVASSERAVNLATQRFNLGLADFLNVLDAQRQLYDLQDQLAVSQQAVTTDLVALYKSLGGGWESFPSVRPPRPAQPAVIAAARSLRGGADRASP